MIVSVIATDDIKMIASDAAITSLLNFGFMRFLLLPAP
jgi:hypothetical protein